MEKLNEYLQSTKELDKKEFQPQSLNQEKAICKCLVCCPRSQDPDESIKNFIKCIGESKKGKFSSSLKPKPQNVKQLMVKINLINAKKQKTKTDPLETTNCQSFQIDINKSSMRTEIFKLDIEKLEDTKDSQQYTHNEISMENYLLRLSEKKNQYALTTRERAEIEKEVDEKRAQRRLQIIPNNAIQRANSVKYNLMKIALDNHKKKIMSSVEDVREMDKIEDIHIEEQQNKSNMAFQQLNPRVPISLNEILQSTKEKYYTQNFKFLLGNFTQKKSQYLDQSKQIYMDISLQKQRQNQMITNAKTTQRQTSNSLKKLNNYSLNSTSYKKPHNLFKMNKNHYSQQKFVQKYKMMEDSLEKFNNYGDSSIIKTTQKLQNDQYSLSSFRDQTTMQ